MLLVPPFEVEGFASSGMWLPLVLAMSCDIDRDPFKVAIVMPVPVRILRPVLFWRFVWMHDVTFVPPCFQMSQGVSVVDTLMRLSFGLSRLDAHVFPHLHVQLLARFQLLPF